ncbi:hypothetical protein PPNSA23_40390 [Phyllobacterium phragmitis]|uniref:Uncharacterized protein n=1 Tax=Phyllobacterium phragmitis TaxID=2670329 RepID=A0ABQ0H5E5_9HYPH
MASGVEEDERAVGNTLVNIGAHGRRGDHILVTLQHEGAGGNAIKVGAVVGKEGDPGEALGNFRVCHAERVGKLLAEFRRSGLPMITGAIACDHPI